MSTTLVEEFAMAVPATLEPLTVDQYHEMIRQGILVEGSPIELIDGLLVRKDRRDNGGSILTVGIRHANTIIALTEILMSVLDRSTCHVRSQQPITLDRTNEPEPDLSVATGKITDYARQHPGPDDVLLVVEVADSSLSFDRGEKLRKYASAGIPTYWIVNLNNDTVEVYTQPDPIARSYRHDMIQDRDCVLSLEVAGVTMELAIADFMA